MNAKKLEDTTGILKITSIEETLSEENSTQTNFINLPLQSSMLVYLLDEYGNPSIFRSVHCKNEFFKGKQRVRS